MKKMTALLLALLLTLSLCAFTPAMAAELGDPTGVTISLWHARSTGANYDQLTAAIKEFNETNPYGITVEEVFQGNNDEVAQKTMTAIAGRTAPTLTTLTVTYITEFATNGVLADMSGYAERDKESYPMDNYLDALLEFSYYDGQLISFPYCRSTAVFYYNKAMFEAAGYTEAPKTMEDLAVACKAIIEKNEGVDGLSFGNNDWFYYNKAMFEAAGYTEAPKTMEDLAVACKAIIEKNEGVDGLSFGNNDWFIGNFLVQLGSTEIDADDQGMTCLEDGSMLKVLSSWKGWIDDGWCIAPTVATAATNIRELFYQGKLACFLESSGGMTNILRLSRENGVDAGVAYLPYLAEGKPACPAGGTNLAVLASATPNEQAAAWEFIKFLGSDAQSADNAIASGYLPITKSAAETDVLKAYWAEKPEYKVAFDQLNENGHDYPFSVHLSEVKTAIENPCSMLIIDGSITPEEALKSIQKNAAQIEW